MIDLEGLAKHRGSSFGGVGLASQPTQEQFENELVMQLESLDHSRPVWIEDESRLIGRCFVPNELFQQMLSAPLFFLPCPQKTRVKNLMQQYGTATTEELLAGLNKIAKRLGSQRMAAAKALIENGNREGALEHLLDYYDRAYRHQLSKRSTIYELPDELLSWPCACPPITPKS